MDIVIQQTLYGISLGLVNALIALGFNLTYGLNRVVNFSHGAFYALGAYLAFAIISMYENFWLGILISPAIVALVAFFVEDLLIKRLYGKDIDISIIVTYATLLIITSIIKAVWGLKAKNVNVPEILRGQLVIGNASLPFYYIFVAAISCIAFVALWFVINKTMLGKIIKAGIESKERVESLGININLIFKLNFVIGSTVAAFAGGIVSPLILIEPTIGQTIILSCFAIVVLGGFGSIFGALIGGLIIGLVLSYTAIFFPVMAEATMYILMAIVLLIRPRGLFGIE
jgi:branched-chain amino acid transport system permease protein